ncbi:MAG: hypothetical protein QM756_44530 [Polyangiaceae bacterium]
MWNRGWVVVAALSLNACLEHDDNASLGGVESSALAVGAFVGLSPGDACRGGGKINFCSSEELVAIEELSSRDPSVVEIVASADMPFTISTAPFFAHGMKPGKATIDFRGSFDDGSVRSTSVELEVRAVDKVVLRNDCLGLGSTSLVTLPGAEGGFHVDLLGGGATLSGFHPNAVTLIDGLTLQPTTSATYIWQAPDAPTTIALRSPLFSGVVGTLKAYGPSDVAKLTLEPLNGAPVVATALGQDFYVESTQLVTGIAPCKELPIIFKSDTPAVCSGPHGESVFSANEGSRGLVKVNAEGVCTLRGSVDGERFFDPLTMHVFVVTPREDAPVAGFGNLCSEEGATTCSLGRAEQAICKDGKLHSAKSCGETAVCDFIDPSSAGCVGEFCAVCRGLRQ